MIRKRLAHVWSTDRHRWPVVCNSSTNRNGVQFARIRESESSVLHSIRTKNKIKLISVAFQLDNPGLRGGVSADGFPGRTLLELGGTIGQFRFAATVRTAQLPRHREFGDRMRMEYHANRFGRLRLSQRHWRPMSAGARNIHGPLARHSFRVSYITSSS